MSHDIILPVKITMKYYLHGSILYYDNIEMEEILLKKLCAFPDNLVIVNVSQIEI